MASKYQVRSVSLPSRSHPVSVRIEQELNSLKSWEASSTSTSSTEVCCVLARLEELYNSVDELLTMQSTEESLSRCRNEQWDSDLFDGSVKILDVCSTSRETMLMVKAHVQDMQSALRRRKDDSSFEKSVSGYLSFRKSMGKNSTKMSASLKKINLVSDMSSFDDDNSRLAIVLTEMTGVTIAVFESLLTFLAASSKPKANKWSLVSSLMNKKVASCQDQTANEFSNVDNVISKPILSMQAALESLTDLEISIGCIEDRLESIFRCLVRLRVSLLNNMSN